MKNARRKLEVPMPAAMLCKIQRDKYRETCHTVEEHKTKYARIVEADESLRKRMEGSPHKHHEGRFPVREGVGSLSHCNLVRKFVLMLQAIKYQIQRQQWRRIRENTSMAADKNQRQE